MKNKFTKNKNSGFTLIEMLLVVALIAVLVGIVIIAINPNKQLGDARNAVREVNLSTIADSVYQYMIDGNGPPALPITSTSTEICQTDALTCVGMIDMTPITLKRKYLTSMPVDPLVRQGNGTGYFIHREDNRILLEAPYAEQGKTIEVIK